ncbi:MAG: heavy metal-associated domain-containing protein [Bacteroidales bacterium]|nr:heavy metal-associated domain-containing protein [Bacteroidales bacterium]
MEQILHIINEMSPYLLLGFLLAGLMHAFVPGQMYSRYLARPTFRSVFNAALLGIPLPLCSCGVIPTAMSLRREGASKGSAVSFLIATPQTGVDSIIATYSLMGLPFAIVRPIAALFTAIFGGQMVNWFDRDGNGIGHNHENEHHGDECCHDDHCDCGCGHNHDGHAKTFWGKMREALDYAFVDMMADIGKWLVIGLIVAGLITVFVPDSFFHIFADNSLLSMLLVLCMAVPMYLCATGSIPIAVALMMKGLTPGAGLVMLMAGPASNIASILVINKVLGRRTLIVYLASIIVGAVGFGLAIDHLLPREWFTSALVADADCCHEETSWFTWLCTGLLAALLANALIFHRHDHHHHHEHQHQNQTAMNQDEMRFHIVGMNCNHCRMNAEKAIASVPGVESVSVDLDSREARVTGNASMDDIRKAVESIGFEVEEKG